MNEKLACAYYALRYVQNDEDMRKFAAWFLATQIKNHPLKKNDPKKAKEAAIDEFTLFWSTEKRRATSLTELVYDGAVMPSSAYAEAVVNDTAVVPGKSCSDWVSRFDDCMKASCKLCAFGGAGMNKNTAAERSVLQFLAEKKEHLNAFHSAGGNEHFFRSHLDIGEDIRLSRPYVFPVLRYFYEEMVRLPDVFYAPDTPKGRFSAKRVKNNVLDLPSKAIKAASIPDYSTFSGLTEGIYRDLCSSILSAKEIDENDMRLTVAKWLSNEKKERSGKKAGKSEKMPEIENTGVSGASEAVLVPEKQKNAPDAVFGDENVPSGANTAQKSHTGHVTGAVETDESGENNANYPDEKCKDIFQKKQEVQELLAGKNEYVKEEKPDFSEQQYPAADTSPPAEPPDDNEIKSDISATKDSFNDLQNSDNDETRKTERSNNGCMQLGDTDNCFLKNDDQFIDINANFQTNNLQKSTEIDTTEFIIPEDKPGLPTKRPPSDPDDIIMLHKIPERILKKLIPFHKCAADVFAYTANIGILPIEIIQDDYGEYYYLLWMANGRYFAFCPVSESSGTLPAEMILLLRKRSTVKVCWQPYFLHAVSRSIGLNVENVHSIFTVDLLLNKNALPCGYDELVRYYAAVLRGKAVKEKDMEPALSPLYNAMPYYADVLHVQLREGRLSPDEYKRSSSYDTVLGISYLLSLNFKTDKIAFQMSPDGRISFLPYGEMEALRQGFLITYAINEEDIPGHCAIDLYKNALIYLEQTGRFRKINMQIIRLDENVLHLFVEKKCHEYLTTVLQNFFNKWAVKNEIAQFALIVDHKPIMGKSTSSMTLSAGRKIDLSLAGKMAKLIAKRRFVSADSHKAQGVLELRKKAKHSRENILPFLRSR